MNNSFKFAALLCFIVQAFGQYCSTMYCSDCVGLAYGNYDPTCGWCVFADGTSQCQVAASSQNAPPPHDNCTYWIPYSREDYSGQQDKCKKRNLLSNFNLYLK
jgi:hypothetical protein